MKKNDSMYSHFMRAVKKLCIMVKMIGIIMMSTVLQVSAGTNPSYSQSVKMNLQLKNVNLEQVIWAIQKQSEFTFFYSSEEVQMVKGLNVDVVNETAEGILGKCLAGQT